MTERKLVFPVFCCFVLSDRKNSCCAYFPRFFLCDLVPFAIFKFKFRLSHDNCMQITFWGTSLKNKNIFFFGEEMYYSLLGCDREEASLCT